MSAILSLVETPDLLIRHLPGAGESLTVIFSSIGGEGEASHRDEFVGVGSEAGRNHVLFVTDRKRSWYSRPGLQQQVVETVLTFKDRSGSSDVVTLGNSMGGHGAMLFAKRLGARAAIAFAPQYSLSPAVLTENRWDHYRPHMTESLLADLGDWVDGSFLSYAIFGNQRRADDQHMRRLTALAGTAVWQVFGAGHSVARVLKERGKLAQSVRAMRDEAPDGVIGNLLGPKAKRLVPDVPQMTEGR